MLPVRAAPMGTEAPLRSLRFNPQTVGSAHKATADSRLQLPHCAMTARISSQVLGKLSSLSRLHREEVTARERYRVP